MKRNWNNIQKYIWLIGAFGLAALIGSSWVGLQITLWVLGIGALISLASVNLAPTRILKWQRAQKLSSYHFPDLYAIVNELASKAGIQKTPEVFLIRNNVPNAFALGSKEKPVIGISSGLVSVLDERELRGVIAHEISHISNNDLFIKGISLSFGNLTNTLSTVGKFLLLLSIPLFLMGYETFSFAAILLMVFSPGLNYLLQMGLSRSMEFVADEDAAKLTNDPMGLASALHKIERISRPWWMNWRSVSNSSSDWLRSHPNTQKRIEQLRSMVKHHQRTPVESIYQENRVPVYQRGNIYIDRFPIVRLV